MPELKSRKYSPNQVASDVTCRCGKYSSGYPLGKSLTAPIFFKANILRCCFTGLLSLIQILNRKEVTCICSALIAIASGFEDGKPQFKLSQARSKPLTGIGQSHRLSALILVSRPS